FSATHRFEFGVMAGVSPVLFYDPAERVIATLHANHTYEKVVFDPWQQTTYDVNDTCAPRGPQTGDPRTDPDIQGFVAAYCATPSGRPAISSAAVSCSTLMTCSATASTNSAWKPAHAGC